MPSSLPPLPYIVAMDVEPTTGVSFRRFGQASPGMPAIPFGTNGKVAWGPTSNRADVTDLFVEKPAADEPGRYVTENGDVPFTVRQEIFRVRHGEQFTDEKRTFRSTRHGVIVNDFMDRLPRDFPLVALEQAPMLGTDSLEACGGCTARRPCTKRGRRCEASPRWSATGSLPMTREHRVCVTVGFPCGRAPWELFPCRMEREIRMGRARPGWPAPSLEDPPQGFIATANNEVVQPDLTGYPINFEGDVPFRVQRIDSRLSLGRPDQRSCGR